MYKPEFRMKTVFRQFGKSLLMAKLCWLNADPHLNLSQTREVPEHKTTNTGFRFASVYNINYNSIKSI